MALTNEDIAVDFSKVISGIELGELFSRAAPVHLEVGSGKGTFLLHEARAHPDVNYLGIEWANKFYRYSVDRMRRWQVGNVRVLRTDAREFIGRYLADGSVGCFHVYFPDPWPKKRHHKRRLLQPDFANAVVRCLEPGGQLHVATDWEDYAMHILKLLQNEPQLRNLAGDACFMERPAYRPRTKYEDKGTARGHSVWDLVFERA